MKHKKLAIVTAVAVALAVCSATAVVAATSRDKGTSTQSGVDHQKVAWRVGSANTVSTKARAWAPLPLNDGGCSSTEACGGTTPLRINSAGDITVTFSGNFTGAPVEIRVRDSGKVMRPGAAKFKPASGGGESFSYTFFGLAKSATCRDVQLEWRSPSGAQTRMQRGAVVVDYSYKKPSSKVGCA